MHSDFLAAMAASSAQRCAAAREVMPEAELRALVASMPAPPALQLGDFSLIAEVKLSSPSAGNFAKADGIAVRAQQYLAAGAAAISVLTEPEKFAGSLDHLREVAAAVSVPVMRKDFLVSPYQVYEARAAGAGGVLLIAALFAPGELATMVETAKACGLFVLLEVFAPEEIAAIRSLTGEGVLLGVNCRDLRSLDIDPSRFEQFAAVLQGDDCVAESGMLNPESVARVAALGFSAALVGSALMQSDAPGELLGRMLAAGRRSRCESR